MVEQQLSLFDVENEPLVQGNGYVMDIKEEVPMANGRCVSDDDIDALLRSKKRRVKKLKGDGDFRSKGCAECLIPLSQVAWRTDSKETAIKCFKAIVVIKKSAPALSKQVPILLLYTRFNFWQTSHKLLLYSKNKAI